MSDQLGFNGTALFATHSTIAFDANGPEFGLLTPAPVTWFVVDAALGSGTLTYFVDVTNTMLHYTVQLGLQTPLVFTNLDEFTDVFGTLPPILGASVLRNLFSIPLTVHTTEDAIVVEYPGIGPNLTGASFDIQVSFTNPVANDDSFLVPANTTAVFDPLANDLDLDGNVLFVTIEDGPDHGTLIRTIGGGEPGARGDVFKYTPDPNSNYVGPDSFTYTISDGVATSTATVNLDVFPHAVALSSSATSGDHYIDSLLTTSHGKWLTSDPSPHVGPITFSFPQSVSELPSGYNTGKLFQTSETAHFALGGYQQSQAVRAILTGETASPASDNVMLATSATSFINAPVQEVNGLGNGLNALGDIRIGNLDVRIRDLAYTVNLAPTSSQHGENGDVWFTNAKDYPNNTVLGTSLYFDTLHELGHALGLDHAHEFGILMPSDGDGVEFTVMTYRAYPEFPDLALGGWDPQRPITQDNHPAAAADGVAAIDYPQTFMMYDIAALQFLYGADYGPESNNTNTSYTWDTNTGETKIQGPTDLEPVSQGIPSTNTVFLTIWDGGGIDTYDMSNYANGVVIDLTPGSWSINSEEQRAVLENGIKANGTVYNALLFQDAAHPNGDPRSLIENAIGGSGDDTLTGNDADNVLTGNAGIDTLVGGNGNDTLIGGAGDDILDGGTGSNTIIQGAVFAAVQEANVVAGNDGNDTLNGGPGDDTLYAGTGNDVIDGGSGSDTVIYPTNLSDYSVSLNADNSLTVAGSDGTYTLTGVETLQFADQNAILGDNGDNNFIAGPDAEAFIGGSGQDTVSYAEAPALKASLADPSTNTGWAAGDTYSSIENLIGSAFADKLIGDGNNNVLEGGLGKDQLDGGLGIDTASYEHATAAVIADLSQPKNNLGEAAAGDTYKGIENLLGSSFKDQLVGNDANNVLTGGDGDDSLFGKSGNDQLIGGLGADTLKGGDGKDQFIQLSFSDGVDRIQDFDFKNDTLVFSASGFGDVLQPGQSLVAGSTFIANNAPTATTTAATFLYDIDDHSLFWDADGSTAGGVAPQQVIQFDQAVALKADDFTIIG